MKNYLVGFKNPLNINVQGILSDLYEILSKDVKLSGLRRNIYCLFSIVVSYLVIFSFFP